MAQGQAVHIFPGINLLYTIHRRYGGHIVFTESQSGEHLYIHGVVIDIVIAGGIPHVITGGPHTRKEANTQRHNEQNGTKTVHGFTHGAHGIFPECFRHEYALLSFWFLPVPAWRTP